MPSEKRKFKARVCFDDSLQKWVATSDNGASPKSELRLTHACIWPLVWGVESGADVYEITIDR